MYCSTNAFRLRSRSNWSIIRLKSYRAVDIDEVSEWEVHCDQGYDMTHRSHASVIGEHQAADPAGGLHVRRPAGEGDLDGRRAPRDEIGQLSLTDPEEGLVDLIAELSVKRSSSEQESLRRTSVGSTSPWMMLRMEM